MNMPIEPVDIGLDEDFRKNTAGMIREFMDFLKEYKVIALAIAFVIGQAANTLVQSFANNIIMSMIQPLMGAVNWKTAVLVVGPFKFMYGQFVSDAINFVIIAFAVFLMAKMVMKEEKVTKK